MQVVLLVVEQDGHGVEVVVIALVGQLHVNDVPVDGAPDAAEVVVEDAVVPVGGHVVVGAQVEHLVVFLVHIHQGEADAGQHVIGLGAEGQNGVAVVVQVQGRVVPVHVLQGDHVLQFLDAGKGLDLALVQLAGQLVGIQGLKGLAGAHAGVGVQIVRVAVVGVVAAQAGGLGAVGAAHLIEHAVAQCIGDGLGRVQQIAALPGQVAQVHHVGEALLTGVAAVVLALGGGAAQLGEEGGVLGGHGEGLLAEGLIGVQQGGELGQVGEGQGGLVLGAGLLAALIIRVADDGAQLLAVHGGVLGQSARPAGVEPAVARLGLFRGHQILGKVLEGSRHVHGGHQAGVKAHQLQGGVFLVGRPDGVEGLV